jgi:Uri superfamily endonuclease
VGFGSTDCRCPAHLIRFSRPPSRRSFIRQQLPEISSKQN